MCEHETYRDSWDARIAEEVVKLRAELAELRQQLEEFKAMLKAHIISGA